MLTQNNRCYWKSNSFTDLKLWNRKYEVAVFKIYVQFEEANLSVTCTWYDEWFHETCLPAVIFSHFKKKFSHFLSSKFYLNTCYCSSNCCTCSGQLNRLWNEPPHDKTNKVACAPSEDSDQPGHLPSLIRAFAVRMKKPWVLSYPYSTQRRLIRLGGCQGWSESSLGALSFLAHLSQRLTRWAYSIPMVRRPSVVVVVGRRPHFQTWISLKPVSQSWSNFMCSIIGVGERLHKVLGQIGSKAGVHGNRKPPFTYNGENDVSTFSRLFLIWSFLYLQVMRTCIKSQTSSNSSQIGPLTTELAALERLKNFP